MSSSQSGDSPPAKSIDYLKLWERFFGSDLLSEDKATCSMHPMTECEQELANFCRMFPGFPSFEVSRRCTRRRKDNAVLP